jgi:hypothetical protein
MSKDITITVQNYKALLLDQLALYHLTDVLSDMPIDYNSLVDTVEYQKDIDNINARFED